MTHKTPSAHTTCLRCVREAAVFTGEDARTRLRGVRHRRLALALDDERALALFFAIFPAALTADAVVYRRQGAGCDPQPIFVSGLAMCKYGMWAADHAVGSREEAHTLLQIGLQLSTAVAWFPQVRAHYPEMPSAIALAVCLVHDQHPTFPITTAVRRLVGLWD